MQSRKVLIIDDDKDLSMIIMDMLEDNGFESSLATTLESAYTMLENDTYNIILLDINLPDGSGFELCKELRKVSKVPVIFASARTSADDKVTGLDIGADYYIPKPYSLKELMSVINSILRRTDAIEQNTIELNAGVDNTIIIDKSNRMVTRNNSPVNLSIKEYDLLLFMSKNLGQALSKDVLISEVWGAFSDVEQSTLTVHIRWLREKLESEPSNPKFIKTVWGVGYMLQEVKCEA